MNRSKLRVLRSLLAVLLICAAVTLTVDEVVTALPIGALADSRVQEQLMITGLLNLSAGIGSLVATSQLELAIQDPESWCSGDTAYADQRIQGLVVGFSGLLSTIFVEVRHGFRGDLGLSYIAGFLGYMSGYGLGCSVSERIMPADSSLRSVVNLSVPLVLSTVSSVLGYHIRYLQSGSIDQ